MVTDVFYLHTPPECKIGSVCFGSRATIACKIDESQNIIKYGIAICSNDDNFSRKKGRELSTERLNNGFKSTSVDKIKRMFKNPNNPLITPEDVLMEFANNLSKSIQKDYDKYKRKINKIKLTNETN